MEKRAFFHTNIENWFINESLQTSITGQVSGKSVLPIFRIEKENSKKNQLFKTHQPFLWAELKIYYQSFSATAPDWLPILPRYRRALLRSHFYWRLTAKKGLSNLSLQKYAKWNKLKILTSHLSTLLFFSKDLHSRNGLLKGAFTAYLFMRRPVGLSSQSNFALFVLKFHCLLPLARYSHSWEARFRPRALFFTRQIID